MKKRKIACMVLAALILALGAGGVVLAQTWEAITEGLYQDPVTGDFVYTTIDKERTSNIYYRTQGFTIADAYKDENGKIVETSRELEFNFALSDPNASSTSIELGNGIIATTWIILQNVVMEKIAAVSADWYNKIANPSGEVYLKMDAILAVYDAGKYGDGLLEGWSGALREDGTWDASLFDIWDKYTYDELKTLYGWDPSFFDNHFDKALLIAMGLIEDDNNPAEGDHDPVDPDRYPAGGDEMVDIIGKRKPDYFTYNYDPTGRFYIGEAGGGIPTSEDVTNGYHADEWYGWTGISRRNGASHTWNFSGNISWSESVYVGQYFDEDTQSWENRYVSVSRTEPYSYVVERTVRYWYLDTAAFYDLNDVVDENEVFPGGKHSFSSYIETRIRCMVNGQDLTSVTQVSYAPDDDYHVDWPQLTADQMKINVDGGSSKSAAIAAFVNTAEGRVKPEEEIYVRNDELTINGNTYMSGAQYLYRDFHTNKGEPNTYNEIGDDDYGLEQSEERGTIPKETANHVYGTSITANYRQIVLGTGAIKVWSKTPYNSGIDERILAGYTQNEKIRVHTPTISPVVIADPSTHEKLELADTDYQLVTSAVNADAEYQLLLDGTYTIKFIPEEHFEHIGYPEMAPTLYNKYCKFKQCAFPFTIQLDGKIYSPDDTGIDTDGEAKLPGYTEWIDLPDFEIDDFYIPSWATEGPDYTVKFRVAPENVVDQYGVNHIDDVEYLRNVTLNGDPLYNYVSTYDITAQVSGRIYDFQAVGINDKDMFGGLAQDGVSNGHGYLVQNFPFCPSREEKRTGILNRLGGTSVRYSVDGLLTGAWDPDNTLPFSVGRSNSNKSEGTLRKGNTFAFTVKTMANLWDEEGDYLVIKPTFRYIDKNGAVNDNIDVYADVESSDGAEILSMVGYGSRQDTENYSKVSISDLRFDGSYYMEDKNIPRVLTQDDVAFSREKTNAWLYQKNIAATPSWPVEAYINNNAFLKREDKCFCLSKIILSSQLRLLTGNLEQLERNLSRESSGLLYLKDRSISGAYDVTESANPELWELHRKSMQTWYGAYYIPNQLYITDDRFMADADGDGVEEEYDNIWDYTSVKGYIEGEEEFIKKDGYLVINFQIMTVNNNTDHLLYFGSNADQWQIEGAPDKVTVGDKDIGEDIEVEVKSGDVAIVDLEKSVTDRYYVGFNRIN